MVRIAEVSPPWLSVPPKGYGGIELVVSLLVDGLHQRGHDVTLFATGDSKTSARLDFVVPEAPGSRAVDSAELDVLHTLFSFRDPGRFDIFHTHGRLSPLVAGALVDTPVVHTIHGDFDDTARRIYGQVADKLAFIAISEAQRSRMPELNYAGVVHNGIDTDAYPFCPDKEDFLLFIGRAAPEKGVLPAIRTARAVGLPIVLALKIAEDREREHWERDAVPELPPNATVLREIGHERKTALLARARALLFPIDWEEPFGLVMVEAMACGTPVIATPRGAVPEIVADGETGFVVAVEDYVAEASAALRRLDELDPMAARRRVAERFSKDVMVEGYEQIFEKVRANS